MGTIKQGTCCCLQACGFELVFQEGSGEEAQASDALEGFAVLPEHADLAPLQAALQLLGHPQPAQQMRSSPAGASTSQSTPPSGPAGLHPPREVSQGNVLLVTSAPWGFTINFAAN